MPTINLNVASLREFQKKAQLIQTNNLLPVLVNLLLEYKEDRWQITKNNLQAVLVGPVKATGDPATVLLDERIFFALLSTTKSDTIIIEITDKVRISDGIQDTNLPVESPASFPKSPEYSKDSELIQLDKATLRAIKIASNFITNLDTAGGFRFVHAVPGVGVFGFHNSFCYINTAINTPVVISLSKSECEVLGGFESIGFLDRPNHHLFFNSGYVYIFTKTEVNVLNIGQVVDRFKLPGKEFSVSKDFLLEFCNLANIVSENPLAMCKIEPRQEAIRLSLTDSNYNKNTERVIKISGEAAEFSFNSRVIYPAMSAVPYEILKAKINQNCLIISGDDEWFCFMEMQK